MNVKYFPESATSINDKVILDDFVSFLGKEIRKYMPRIRKSKCNHCGTWANLEIHHIRPVWTYAVQIMIDLKPQTHGDLSHLCKGVPNTNCNDLDNLIVLCNPCHRKEEKIAYRKWKKHFEDNYRVVFGVRNLRRELELANCKPSLSDLRWMT